MKKLLPYLIIITIVINLFAPISISKNSTQISGKLNKVEAVGMNDEGATSPKIDDNQTVDQFNREQAAKAAKTPQVTLATCGTGFWGTGSIPGCIVTFLYWTLYIPSSWLMAIAGKFFDWTFDYSVSDVSYRTSFVTEGWKITRDICNIFFIFVLLYIAFKIILDLGGHSAKELIVHVVLIAIMINFSMFAARVIIDTSNILARVFYNSDAIKISTASKSDGTEDRTVNQQAQSNSTLGEISLSSALIEKINPQNIISSASDIANDDTSKGSKSFTDETHTVQGELDVGTSIVILILCVIVNLVGFFVFLNVGLIFVARVITLWFAMIFAPLAFFSYTVPEMQGLDYVGWQKWWKDLIGASFVAPIFIFFMYLIILFLSKGFADLLSSNTQGVAKLLQTIIPFVFIMLLLKQAQSMATKFSGSAGEAVSGAIKAGASVALMATGAGVAAGGRGIGKMMARASNGNTTTQKYAEAKGNPEKMKDLNWRDKTFGRLGAKMNLDKTFGNKKDADGRVQSGIGGILNKARDNIKGKDHADHKLNEYAQGITGNKDAKYSELGLDEKKKVKDSIDRDTLVKELTGQNKKYDQLGEKQKKLVDSARSINPSTGEALDWSASLKEHNEIRGMYGKKELHSASHMEKESKEKISTKDRLISMAPTGSWNPMNISAMSAAKNDAFSSKMLFGLSSAMATGMRSGLKGMAGVNLGAGGSKDFATDIKNAFSEALKGAKLNVEIKGGGGHGGGEHDDHGHGGGGGGHH
ncbi:MAG: hypothetical protein NTX85_00640 [Candidatus Nomurabacteria bacterium]|nr:hypothetical protein [Candidatus Nomurabacteria bacterium]